ncbi:fibronectin type III domain-containing protein [Jatrophihabitans sp. DSM 45814]
MEFSKIPARYRGRRGIAVGAIAATVLAGGVVTAAASASPDGTAAPIDVLLTVGATQSDKVVSWYYQSPKAQLLQLEQLPSSHDSFDASKAKTIVAKTALNTVADTPVSLTNNSGATVTPSAQSGYSNAHVDLHGLKANTYYSYKVGSDDTAWSGPYTFYTGSKNDDFKFLFFGDPQIGSSGHTDNDSAGWAQTLSYATKKDGDAELFVSGGDQVEHADDEYEWTAFADPTNATSATDLTPAGTNVALKENTWAPTIGNHEGEAGGGGRAYSQHFFPPNIDDNQDFYAADGASPSPAGAASSVPGTENPSTYPGGDYWYIYKDVLFIDLNSNAYSGDSDPAHVAYVSNVINTYGKFAKWKVLVYHHSIYSPAAHANDVDNAQRRVDFTTAFSDLGVNLVLQGHDHSYSRSYQILNGQKAVADEQPGDSSVVQGPGGVIYVTANSASGSKYYDLTAPTGANGYGADPNFSSKNTANLARHWANSVESQLYVPSYVKIQVTDHKLTVTDLATGTPHDVTNSAVHNQTGTTRQAIADLGDQSKTGPAATAAQVPGGVIDHFNLSEYNPPTRVSISGPDWHDTLTAKLSGGDVPEAATVSYVWKANGVPFGGHTSTQTVSRSQKGKHISVEATVTYGSYKPVKLKS